MRHGGSFGFCGGQSYPADAEAAGQCRAAAHVKAEAASDAGHAACHGADSGSAVGAPAAMVFHLPCSGGGTFVYLIYGAQGRSTAPAASDVLSAPPPGAAAARGPAARRVFPPRPVPAAIRSGQKDISGRRECLFIRLSGDYTTVCRGALPDGAFSRFAAAGGS